MTSIELYIIPTPRYTLKVIYHIFRLSSESPFQIDGARAGEHDSQVTLELSEECDSGAEGFQWRSQYHECVIDTFAPSSGYPSEPCLTS